MRDARCAMRDARCAMRDARCAMRERHTESGPVCRSSQFAIRNSQLLLPRAYLAQLRDRLPRDLYGVVTLRADGDEHVRHGDLGALHLYRAKLVARLDERPATGALVGASVPFVPFDLLHLHRLQEAGRVPAVQSVVLSPGP